MEHFKLDRDITVLYVTAHSFPAGIREAFDELFSQITLQASQDYFGISRPEASANGTIVYRAAVEETEKGQASRQGFSTLIIRQGIYISLDVSGYKEDSTKIARAFETLLAQPNLDPEGYCVEWYSTDADTVRCMIRLEQ